MSDKLFERLVVAVEKLADHATAAPQSRVVSGICGTREQLRDEVHRLYKLGHTGTAIAQRLKVSGPTVSRILHGDKKQDGD
jgi:DNA-binding MarR family transcriptional regulator